MHNLHEELEALERKLEEVFSLHLKSAQSEGRVLEDHILALVKDIVMTTASELQGKINALSDKFSQVEADVGGMVAKVGGAAGAAGDGTSIPQAQLDAMGNAVDGLSTRADALVKLVVNGPEGTPTSPPDTSGASTPSAPSTPAPPSTSPISSAPPISSTTPAAPPASPSASPSSSIGGAPASPPPSV